MQAKRRPGRGRGHGRENEGGRNRDASASEKMKVQREGARVGKCIREERGSVENVCKCEGTERITHLADPTSSSPS